VSYHGFYVTAAAKKSYHIIPVLCSTDWFVDYLHLPVDMASDELVEDEHRIVQ